MPDESFGRVRVSYTMSVTASVILELLTPAESLESLESLASMESLESLESLSSQVTAFWSCLIRSFCSCFCNVFDVTKMQFMIVNTARLYFWTILYLSSPMRGSSIYQQATCLVTVYRRKPNNCTSMFGRLS